MKELTIDQILNDIDRVEGPIGLSRIINNIEEKDTELKDNEWPKITNAIALKAQELSSGHNRSMNKIKPVLLNEQQAAEYLGVAAGTLTVWRCTGRYNLPFVKVGRFVKYKQSDLDKWIENRTQHKTNQQN